MKNTKDTTFPSYNIISINSVLNGEIKSDGDFRIDGSFTGTIDILGSLAVGPKGVIKGSIYCNTLEVSGRIEGNAQVNTTTYLLSQSIYTGEIHTSKIIIQEDAVFNGTCKMT